MILLSPNVVLATAALAYAVELNWAVFPLKPREKTPLVERGFHDATTSPDAIGEWWARWPEANIGIATGEASGIIVVDVDGPEGQAAIAVYGEMPRTPVAKTGKGWHIVFARGDNAIRNSASKLGEKIDVRGDGGYIVAPPSLHPSGHRYEWARGRDPHELALAPIPDAILERLTAPVVVSAGVAPTSNGRLASQIPSLPYISDGTRNSTLTEYAGRLFAQNLGELEVLRLLIGMNESQCRPPLDRSEVEAIVLSIGQAERRKRGTRRVEWLPEVSRPASLVRITGDVLEELGTKNLQPIDAIPTMLPEWNDACRGFGGAQGLARGWHITIGGASGTGKSLLALNLVSSALKAGRAVLYVSLEMSRDQLLSRLLALTARCPVRELELGRLYSEDSWIASARRLEEICNASGSWLSIADRPSNELTQLVPLVRTGIEEGAAMVVLDYVQLVQVRGSDGQNERITAVSQAIQRLAFDHEIVTVALSQFNRLTSFNKDAPPSPESLTGSSSLENDSDQVVLLDHSANKRFGSRMETNVLLAKNRHGPVPSIPVVWDYTTLEVKQRAPDAMMRTEDRYGI